MNMFPNYQNSIPSNRSEMVNDLEIPEVSVSACEVWSDFDDSVSVRSDSIPTNSLDGYEPGSISTASSIPLSRAMTDSDIDYERFRKYKSRSYSDPWQQMRVALDAFPSDYLASLNSFQYSSTDTDASTTPERHRIYNDEIKLNLEQSFDECRVFTPDDPGLTALEEALLSLDLKSSDSELDSLQRT